MLSKVSTMSRLSMFHGRKASHSLMKKDSGGLSMAYNTHSDAMSTHGQAP